MKDTRIIAVGNQKGGCGKSMLSFQIAGSLAAHGSRVMVADGDAQRTLRRLSELSTAIGGHFPVDVVPMADYGARLAHAIAFYMGAYDFLIVDSPPAFESPIFEAALSVADVALIPIVPSPPDLWSAVGTRELVLDALEDNPGLIARVVLNRCKNTLIRAAVTGQAHALGLPVAMTRIHDRTAYEEAWARGCTVLDLGARARDAAVEIHGLLDEIVGLFVADARVAAE